MQNKEQEIIEVLEEKGEAAQKKKKLKINKKHIQGFIAGILVSVIVFTGLLTGFNPGFLTGTLSGNSGEVVCDISYGDVTFTYKDKKVYVSYYDADLVYHKDYVIDSNWMSAVRIIGSTNEHRIIVERGSAIIRLDEVSIKPSTGAALELAPYSFVMLILEGSNELFGGNGSQAILKDDSNTVATMGPGHLTVNNE